MFRLSAFHFSPRLKFLFIVLAVFLVALVFNGPAFAQDTWTASYWNNPTLSGAPTYQRSEVASINYNWGSGSPVPGIINSDFFSAQWRGDRHFDPGRYRFNFRSDDGGE